MMYIFNPLEQFEIKIIMDDILWISNYTSYILILISAIYCFTAIWSESKLLPNKWQIINESMYQSILRLVIDQLGKTQLIYFPLIFTIFNFILYANLIGLIPYGFTITAQFALTLSLSITIIFATTIIGFQLHSLKFISILLPSGTPLGLVPLLVAIESISYLAKALSLGIRLGANCLAGHTLLKIITQFVSQIFTIDSVLCTILLLILPIIFVMALVGLELAIAILQSYVFTTLTCTYIKDSIKLH